MNEWFILSFFGIVVGLPVVFGIGGDAFKRWLKHKEKLGEALNRETAEKAAQYAAQTARLEQRVRVLEAMLPRQPDGPSPAAMPQFN